MNVISVDVETNDKLKKAKLENGFYNIIDARKSIGCAGPCQRSQTSTNDNAGFLRNGDQENDCGK
jgi:hypothetical protein